MTQGLSAFVALLVPVLTASVPAAGADAPPGSAYALPHNFYGAHLLVNDGAPGTRGDKHLRWARHLIGRWGHAKTLLGGIDAGTEGPRDSWIDYVSRCYEIELIPFLRLAGHYDGEKGYWHKPKADAPGDYSSIAAAVKRVVAGLPRSDMCPLYIEVWNEPNLAVEWTGKTDHKEYADFFVQVATAIRSIGDDRIKILNGSLALGPDWTRMLCEDNPRFITSFDVWGSHPYPLNRPPHLNHHAKNVKPDSHFTIDSYVCELDVLRKMGRDNVSVMITETGWDLGNGVYHNGEKHPIIDEYNRADYAMRAFRDYWSKWPEIIAVFPFEFCSEGWQRFDWVYPESDINPDGSPTKPHYQYTVVAALAKPTDTTGAINGTVTVAGLGVRLEDAKVTIGKKLVTTDPMGNFFFAKLQPADYTLEITNVGFSPFERKVEVVGGKNTIVDVELEATGRAGLTGTVRSGDDGKPVRGATITLHPGEMTTTTDRAGKYVLLDCIPARYSLAATAEGRYEYQAENVTLTVGKANRHQFRLGKLPELAGPNMAKNPSMEAGGGGGGKDWIALGFEPLAVDPKIMQANPGAVLSAHAHTGQQAQSVRLFEKETTIRQITHYNTAKPGTRYLAGIWIKTNCHGRNTGAWITFDATENGGAVIGHIGPSKKITGRSNWTWVPLEGVAPAGSQRLSLNLHTQGGSGIAYFDDAYIAEVTPK